MSKFKIGDRVKYIGTTLVPRGTLGTVISSATGRGDFKVEFDTRASGYALSKSKTFWINEINLTLVASNEVNSPTHYTRGNIECIEGIKASMEHEEFLGYLKGTAMAYLWRYRYKGNAKQDLEKARWYLDRLILENNE